MPVCQNNLIVFVNALFKRPLVRRSRFLPDPSLSRPSSLVFRPLLFSRPLVTLFPELALIVFLLAPFLRPLLHFSVPSLSAPSPSPRHASPHLASPRLPRPLFPVRALPAVLPFRAPCQIPSFGCFRRTNAGKGEFRAKKGPKSFFGKNAMKNCIFRARVL